MKGEVWTSQAKGSLYNFECSGQGLLSLVLQTRVVGVRRTLLDGCIFCLFL